MNKEFKISNAIEELKKEGLSDDDAIYWAEQIKSRNLQRYSNHFDDLADGDNLCYFECENKDGKKIGYVLQYLDNDTAKIIGCRFKFPTNSLYDAWMKMLKPITQEQLDAFYFDYTHGGNHCLGDYLQLVKHGYVKQDKN